MIAVVDKPGQLGNRLFRFSHFIAYALDCGTTVADLSFGDYASYFPSLSVNPLCAFPPPRRPMSLPRRLRGALYNGGNYYVRAAAKASLAVPGVKVIRLDWHEFYDLDADPLELHRFRLVLVQGWLFRAGEGVKTYADEIRAFFRPHERTLTTASGVAAAARSGIDILVGLHIRHGDYRTWQGGRFFYSLDRYIDLASQVAELFSPAKVGFLVCSNAPFSASDFPGLTVTMGPGREIDDLYSLAECDYLLGPPSTFTMWASCYRDIPLCTVRDVDRRLRLEDFRVAEGSPVGGSVSYGAG